MKNQSNHIELLRDDDNYYGDLGKMYLSNSDIYALLKNPASYKKHEYSKPMLEGSYFHTLMLEPDKLDSFEIVDASTRSTKLYKEALESSDQEILLLGHEAKAIEDMANKMKSSLDIYEQVYEDGAVYEEPAIKEIYDVMWKGKADVINSSYVIDLKTTADISKFRRSAFAYNYDSQAYLYQQFFGKPVKFIVICKSTGIIKQFECSSEFLESGRDKVMDAVIAWNRFFGPEATDDPESFVDTEIL